MIDINSLPPIGVEPLAFNLLEVDRDCHALLIAGELALDLQRSPTRAATLGLDPDLVDGVIEVISIGATLAQAVGEEHTIQISHIDLGAWTLLTVEALASDGQ